MEKMVVNIGGMSCSHCKSALEKALKSLSGVEEVSVDLEGEKADIEYDPAKVNTEELRSVIREAGYQA